MIAGLILGAKSYRISILGFPQGYTVHAWCEMQDGSSKEKLYSPSPSVFVLVTVAGYSTEKMPSFAYQQKMLDAYLGKVDFPKIRTFNKADNSTNSVFHDLEAAEHM